MNVTHLSDGTPIATIDNFGYAHRAELVKLAIDSSTRTRSQGSNNVGGWKSSDTFFAWQFPCVAALANAIQHRIMQSDVAETFGMLQRKLVSSNLRFADWRENRSLVGWAMVNGRGNYHKWHRHGRDYLVGVYYADPGEPATPTIFDPLGEAGTSHVRLGGVAGSLVMFPGNTWHGVPRYLGDRPRVTVAFEVR